jgi:hypothetical protein
MTSSSTKVRQGSAVEIPRLLLRAMLRGLGIFRIRGLDQIDAAVISPGGVGTTMLIDHLGKYLRVNCADDGDHLKHVPRLPRRIPDGLKVVFVHGDVDEIVASIERRGWVPRHGSKFGSVSSVILTGRMRRDALRRAVKRQIDWFLRLQRPNLLLLRYEELWDRRDEIAEFMGISDTSFSREFPPRKSRTRTDDPQRSAAHDATA